MFNYDDVAETLLLRKDKEFTKLDCGRYKFVQKVIACGCEVHEFQLDKRESVKVSSRRRITEEIIASSRG